jgi:hypothetical protein
VAIKGVTEIFEHWQAVLAQGRDVTADASVATGAFQSAKAAGNLQPDFYHAEVSLGFVVGKGPSQVPQKGENAILTALEPIQPVLFFGLLRALFSRWLRDDWVGLAASA